MTITSDLLYRLLVQQVSNYAIYMMDRDGIVLNWNSGAEHTKGYSASEIVGRNFARFYSPDDQEAGLPRQNLDTALRDGRLITEGWRFRNDGTAFWASVTIDTVRDAAGIVVGFAKVVRDLTEQHTLLVQLEHRANHDALTGLLNRSGLFLRLEEDLANGASLAIHCIDLDHFKAVNDRFGHPAGDAVLQEVTRRIEQVLGGVGYAGRLGGDELVAVQTPVDGSIRDLSAAMISAVYAPIDIGSASVQVCACVGAVQAPAEGADMGTLLRQADAALYRAKNRGCNSIVIDGEP